MPRPSLRPYTLHVVLLSSAALSGCDLFTEGRDCTLSIEPAVVVHITEQGSGRPLAGGARGVVRDGAYVDSLRPHFFITAGDTLVMLSRRAADEREGEYHIDVVHPGYSPATVIGVRVEDGPCHVITRDVTVALIPLG